LVQNDTRTWIVVYSRRLKMSYVVEAFREYYVDMDLDTDADQFHMVINNPGGRYTGMFNKFDPVLIYVNGTWILKGTVDDIEYNWDDSTSVIQLVGRDEMSILIDNDALPGTQENVDIASYLNGKVNEYDMHIGGCNGVYNGGTFFDLGVQNKLQIGANESELSVMSNLLVGNDNKIWYMYGFLYAGKWNTSAPPDYTFVRIPDGTPPSPANDGIPIIKLNLKDSGANLRSEVKIYGSTDSGDNKVEGVAKNDNLISLGISKRRTMRSSNDDSSTKYASSALRKVKEDFRSGIELVVTIKTFGSASYPILIGRTARVIDYITKINSTFFIKGVRYEKNISNGSITTVTMVPDDSTFNVLWTQTGHRGDKIGDSGNDYAYLNGTSTATLSDLMNNPR
jgi:hypothetical protein